jgi:D-alanyl-D-alanine carboxypeptidase
MTLKKTDLAKRQGLKIALRMKNANQANLSEKQSKTRFSQKLNPLLKSILNKSDPKAPKD